MKKFLLIILLAVLFIQSGTAAVGGPTPTITALSVPGSITPGDIIIVNSTTTLQGGGFPLLGDVIFLKISDNMTLGPASDGSVTSATLPVIKFTPYDNFNLLAIGLPIENITDIAALSVSWSIYDDLNASALIEGQINKNIIAKMISEENLLITIGSFQTDPVDWTNGFDLTAETDYFLKLDGLNANFAIKTSNTASTAVSLSDDATLLFETPQLTLYSGQNLGRTAIDASGNASMQFSVASGDKYLIAEFGDLFFSAPSYDFIALNVSVPVTEPDENPTTITYSTNYNQVLDKLEYIVSIKSENNPVLDGIINWQVLNSENISLLSGYLLVNEVNESIYIPTQFNDTSRLKISYLDTSGTYENKEILIDIIVLYDKVPEETEIPEENDIIDITPPNIIVINPPTEGINNNSDSNVGNSNVSEGEDGFDTPISGENTDTGFNLTDYLDVVGIAALQGSSKFKKVFKR